jgi:hypothetical protein
MAGGAETSNIAALPAIARLGACESARGPDADRHVKLLIQFAVEGSLSGAYSHQMAQQSWKRPGSPIGKKGPRKANPKYQRRSRQPWSDKEVKQLRSLAKANTPTGVITV